MVEKPDDARSMILQACRALFAPGQVTELRILGLPGPRGRFPSCGWFNDHETLAKTAANFDANGKPDGIYCTLNPVNDAWMVRTKSPNAVQDFTKDATKKPDILRRHWLPIDIDPCRPTGISATDAEIEAARVIARNTAAWLESMGFPPGLRAFSGNGIHLLYRIDLPNDPEAEQLVHRCLEAIHQKFSTNECKIDVVNSNPDRIFKLYGTMARKGSSTEDRPHRRSRMFSLAGQYPTFADIGIVPREALDALAALAVDAPAPASAGGATKQQKARASKATAAAAIPSADGYALDGQYAVDLDAFIAEHGIAVDRQEPYDGTGLRYILPHCLFDESHTGTSAALGRSNVGALWYYCHHNSCLGKRWRDVAALFPGSATLAQAKADAKATRTKVKTVKPSKRKDGDKSKTADSDDAWGLAGEILADEFMDHDTTKIILRRYKQTAYRYCTTRRCYVQMDDDTMRVMTMKYLGGKVEKLTKRKMGDVLACLEALVTVSSDLELPFMSRIDPESRCCTSEVARYNRITLVNGILDLDAMLAGEPHNSVCGGHTSDWFTVTSLPFAFPMTDDEAACPAWKRFLREVLSDDADRMAVLQEAFGCCFLGRNVYEVFFVLHGVGRNGKSTVLNVLRTLLGVENVSSLSMEQLSEPTFAMQLDNKIANICGDMNALDQVQEGLLKSIVSGDLISARRLYKDPVQFRARCIPWFSCNTLPRFSDTSMGIWRRMQLIPFDLFVADADVDVHLFSRLQTEMPGILLWAIQGAIRLREQGGFTPSNRCNHSLRDYRLHCLPILMWTEECTTVVEGYSETVGDLWRCYRAWCSECGLSKPKPIHQFSKDLQGFLVGQVSFARDEGRNESRREVKGIKINGDAPRQRSGGGGTDGISTEALSYGGEHL